ncbi:MAG: SRPBCC family protein [Bacteroidota bacterium]
MRQFIMLFMLSLAVTAQAQETLETKKIKASHRTVYTDIIIDATPEQVWAVLTDTENFAGWGVFLTDIKGSTGR